MAYQSVFIPGHTSAFVGISVGVALNGTCLTTKQAMQVGANLIGTASLSSVALSATRLKQLGKYLWKK